MASHAGRAAHALRPQARPGCMPSARDNEGRVDRASARFRVACSSGRSMGLGVGVGKVGAAHERVVLRKGAFSAGARASGADRAVRLLQSHPRRYPIDRAQHAPGRRRRAGRSFRRSSESFVRRWSVGRWSDRRERRGRASAAPSASRSSAATRTAPPGLALRSPRGAIRAPLAPGTRQGELAAVELARLVGARGSVPDQVLTAETKQETVSRCDRAEEGDEDEEDLPACEAPAASRSRCHRHGALKKSCTNATSREAKSMMRKSIGVDFPSFAPAGAKTRMRSSRRGVRADRYERTLAAASPRAGDLQSRAPGRPRRRSRSGARSGACSGSGAV